MNTWLLGATIISMYHFTSTAPSQLTEQLYDRFEAQKLADYMDRRIPANIKVVGGQALFILDIATRQQVAYRLEF